MEVVSVRDTYYTKQKVKKLLEVSFMLKNLVCKRKKKRRTEEKESKIYSAKVIEDNVLLTYKISFF